MKKLFRTALFLIVLILAAISTKAQDRLKETPDEDKVGLIGLILIDEMPEYPGGEEELMKYIQQNIQYPTQAQQDSIIGIVYITFVVRKNGDITDIKVLRSPAEALSEEALRVVRSLPRFKPGRQNGKPVNVQYNLPIRFKLY